MNYYQIAAEGRLPQIQSAIEKIIAQYPCIVIMAPSSGMIMIKHQDPIEKAHFFMGEAFVTQCEVEIEGCLGYGCVLGDESERALFGAILDARLGNGFDIPKDAADQLMAELAYIRDEQNHQMHQIQKTKVNFDVKKG